MRSGCFVAIRQLPGGVRGHLRGAPAPGPGIVAGVRAAVVLLCDAADSQAADGGGRGRAARVAAWMLCWLDAFPDSSVVYVGFGTQHALSPAQAAADADALARSSAAFVTVGLGRAGTAMPDGFEAATAAAGAAGGGVVPPRRGVVPHRWNGTGSSTSDCSPRPASRPSPRPSPRAPTPCARRAPLSRRSERRGARGRARTPGGAAVAEGGSSRRDLDDPTGAHRSSSSDLISSTGCGCCFFISTVVLLLEWQ
ncbi:hypothetical protein U9M48_029467 [Paspalum notatum var. saurae]|uniref:Uncharacterized protein n=1 Tax=Paspalum notatum var. saurae TaxID=547442 RepID=A0AAQ3X251_PASNO